MRYALSTLSVLTCLSLGTFASCGPQEPIDFDFDPGDHNGELERVNFSYSCFLRADICGLDYALHRGSEDLLHATGDYRLLRSSVSSSDPQVVAIGAISEDPERGISIELSAVGVGNTLLRITDDDTGELVDQIALRVREARSMEFVSFLGSDDAALDEVTTSFEALGAVEIRVYDDTGAPLQTRTGVEVQVPDLEHVGLRGVVSDGQDRQSIFDNPVQLYPIAAGQTLLTASTVEGLSRSIPLIVAEAQASR